MSNNLERAKALLKSENCTCVLCSDNKTYKSAERGVKPLLDLFNSDIDVKGFSAADKIVGSAAAHLYVLLGVKNVYATVMSRSADFVLSHHGIASSCEFLTEEIINRTNTGLCPMEQAVLGITDAKKAKEAIEKRLSELKRNSEEQGRNTK